MTGSYLGSTQEEEDVRVYSQTFAGGLIQTALFAITVMKNG